MKRQLRAYGSYLFTDKDPVIDELRTMVQERYGRLTLKTLRQLERDGGPSVGCTAGWFLGDTKRPQSAGTEAAGRAMGYKRAWVPLSRSEQARVKVNMEKVAARKVAARKAKRKVRKR